MDMSDQGFDWVQAIHLYETAIASQNEALQVRATVELGRLSKNAPESVLAQTLPVLVKILDSPLVGGSSLIHEAAAYCLNCFAYRGDGALCTLVGQSGAIPSLLRHLPESDGGFRRILAKCLRTIVSSDSLSRIVVARSGGLDVILGMFASCSDDTRRYLLEILGALATLREVRRVIVNLASLSFLVESASTGKMVSRTRAAHAIGLLGATRRVRQSLVESGVIPVLIKLLQEGDMQAKLTASNALGIIASHVDFLRPVARAGAIPLLAELLQGPEPLGREIAEDVFCILGFVEENAISIARHLVSVLQGENNEAKATAADVLWDLSSYKHSKSVLQESGAIPPLIELLRGENDDVREKAAGAVSQLSYNEIDRGALAEAGAIPVLLSLLQDGSEELKDNAAEALINFSEDPLLCDRVSQVLDNPSFLNMQERLARIRASDEHVDRSLRQLSLEQFTADAELA